MYDLARQRQEHLLRVLHDAGDRPVSLVELRERGIGRASCRERV